MQLRYLFVATMLASGAVLAGFPARADRPPDRPTAPSADRALLPFPVHGATLDNGLRVVVIPMGPSGLVGFRTAVRTGARDEYEPGRTGFAHFFEHMMFRGTHKYPADVYNRKITEMGADANAYTSSDTTVYLLNVTAADLEQVMELESDRFKNLAYSEEAFQTEAGAVYGEYRKNRMSPFFAIYEALYGAAFTRHTYGHTAMGYEADIKLMPTLFDYSRTFFDRYYRPDNTVLVVAGDVQPDGVVAMARKYYGDWKPGYVAPQVQAEPPQTAERRVEVKYPGRTLPIVAIGYKSDAFDPTNRTYVASRVLAELAFGETSELYRRVVLDEQWVERLRADPDNSRDPGLFTVAGTLKDAANINRFIAEVDRTATRFQESPPDPERVAAVISHLRYSFLMRLDSPADVAGTIGHLTGVYGSVEAIEAAYRTLAQVTPEDVQAAASRYLQARQRTIAVLRGKE